MLSSFSIKILNTFSESINLKTKYLIIFLFFQDLKLYLDNSKNGVIYISFGTNVDPSLLPTETIQTLIQAFSKLPYDILWKWNKDDLPGRTSNIKISKWLPQSDLLRKFLT